MKANYWHKLLAFSHKCLPERPGGSGLTGCYKEAIRTMWARSKVGGKNQGSQSPKQKRSLTGARSRRTGAWPCPPQTPGPCQRFMQKAGALGGQQGPSLGGWRCSPAWQTASAGASAAGLYGLTTMGLQAGGAARRVSARKFPRGWVAAPERRSQCFPGKRTRGLHFSHPHSKHHQAGGPGLSHS